VARHFPDLFPEVGLRKGGQRCKDLKSVAILQSLVLVVGDSDNANYLPCRKRTQ